MHGNFFQILTISISESQVLKQYYIELHVNIVYIKFNVITVDVNTLIKHKLVH